MGADGTRVENAPPGDAYGRRGMIRDWACMMPSRLRRAARWKTERSAVDALMGRRLGRGMICDWVCAMPSKLGRAYGR